MSWANIMDSEIVLILNNRHLLLKIYAVDYTKMNDMVLYLFKNYYIIYCYWMSR